MTRKEWKRVERSRRRVKRLREKGAPRPELYVLWLGLAVFGIGLALAVAYSEFMR